MSAIATLRSLMEEATEGPWRVCPVPVEDRAEAVAELTALVNGTPQFQGVVWMLTTEQNLAPAITGCGKDSAANAALIVALVNAAPELFRRIEELERALGVCADTMGDLRRAALELGEDADAVMFAAAERACNAALATTKEGA